jgi:stearoyl-CoA desaturase (Delta-9 desaturase)
MVTPRQYLFRFSVLLIVVLPFLGTLLAMWYLWNSYVFLSDVALMVAFTLMTGLGITVGYHRMLTHEGFKTYKPIKALLLIFGCMGFEGDPVGWAGRHIQHHAHSDEEGDPHSPLEGFWHAHMGWMFSSDDSFDLKKYVPHLFQDPVVMFVQRHAWLWMILSVVLPGLIGGWTGLVWGGAVRLFITTHTTFSVNSICHTFGKRPYQTTDESRNNWIVGLLAFGEGWHNNHHAFPRNAFHGMEWWQFDLSGYVIRFCEKAGLMWDVQRVSHETAEAQKYRAAESHKQHVTLASQLALSIKRADDEIQQRLGGIIGNAFTAQDEAKLVELKKQAEERLCDIRLSIVRATNMKRARLMRYQKEVQEILERVRTEAQARTTALGMQAS